MPSKPRQDASRNHDATRILADMPVCFGKKKYRDKYRASVSAKRQRPRTVRPYLCPECRCWHLGHRNKRDKTVDLLRESPKRMSRGNSTQPSHLQKGRGTP
jgi:hypothetical protein